jgi:hypothetical protein
MKDTEALNDASKHVGLQVNTEKTMYMLMSHHQNTEQNHNIKKANRAFENVANFKYLGMRVKLWGFSPPTNYTDRATAACQ